MSELYDMLLTSDGSRTLRHPLYEVTFHSMHGALTESRHVFISSGLVASLEVSGDDHIDILEIGFGTGLNALLARQKVSELGRSLNYTGIEPQRLPWALIRSMEYVALINGQASDARWFEQVHGLKNGKSMQAAEHTFLLLDSLVDIERHKVFDVVFYDAFAPQTQPELWTADCMKDIAQFLRPGGILVTYCAQGQFQRNLKEAGFQVDRLPGPPGKREMVRATLPESVE